MKNVVIAHILAVCGVMPFGAIAKGHVAKDLNSDAVINREVKAGDSVFKTTFFSRKPKGKFENLINGDYVELWAGKDQDIYSFINISGLAQEPAEDLRRMLFFGVESVDFSRSEAAVNARLLQMLKRQYFNHAPMRQSAVIGYDLGVAGAFHSACAHSSPSLILSSGGIFSDEACKPKSLQVLFSVNVGDVLFPWDVATTFTSGELYSLENRLDGVASESRLKQLMGCKMTPIVSRGLGGILETYTCADGNELVVLKNDYEFHQWNGYLNVSESTFNQYGVPYKVPLTNWIYQEFDIR